MISSTPEGTGQVGLSEDQAAAKLEALLGGTADSDGDETREDTPDPDEPEGDEPEEEQDKSEEDEEAEEEPKEPQTFTVKVNGEDVAVTLEELQRGYSREADYTRKTQAIAERAKALDAEKQDLAQLAERTTAILSQLEQSLKAPLYDQAELDQLRYTDPAEWSARMREQEQRAQYVESLLSHKSTLETHLTAEQQRAQQAEVERLKAETVAELQKARPEWSDPAKFKEADTLIQGYASEIGIKAEEWDDILLDHRSIIALHEAAMWRQLQSKRPQVRERIEAVRTARPGAATQSPSKVTEATRAKQRLAKTGRVEDAASAIERLLK